MLAGIGGTTRIFFQNFPASGKFPKKQKESFMFPIHESWNRVEGEKLYSSICLTPNTSKIMEWIVKDKRIAFLEKITCWMTISIVSFHADAASHSSYIITGS